MTALTMPAVRKNAGFNVLEGAIIGLVITALSYYIGNMFGDYEFNLLEALAVFTSYVCTYLCVKERRINYVFGLASTAMFVVVFFQWGLFGSAAANLYLVPVVIYGWFRWNRDEITRPVRRLPLKLWPIYIGVTAAVFFGAWWLLSTLDSVPPLTDLAILALTILAQFLLDNKRPETWAVWAVLNVLAIYTYFNAGLFVIGVQYIFFLLNAGYGAYEWSKSLTRNREAGIV